MKIKLVQLITGLLLVLITGVFWGTWFSLSRTMHHFPAEIFITIGKEIIKNLAAPMSIIMPAGIVGLLVLLIDSRKVRSLYFYYILTSLILFIVALIITVAIEVPIDNQIKTWTTTTVPSNWASIRDRWEVYHTIRTFVSLVGVAAFITAILNRNNSHI